MQNSIFNVMKAKNDYYEYALMLLTITILQPLILVPRINEHLGTDAKTPPLIGKCNINYILYIYYFIIKSHCNLSVLAIFCNLFLSVFFQYWQRSYLTHCR